MIYEERDQLKINTYTEGIRWNMDITSFSILFEHLEITAYSNLLDCLFTLVSFVELVYKLRTSELLFITFHLLIALRFHLFINLASMLLLYQLFLCFLREDTFSRLHLSNWIKLHKRLTVIHATKSVSTTSNYFTTFIWDHRTTRNIMFNLYFFLLRYFLLATFFFDRLCFFKNFTVTLWFVVTKFGCLFLISSLLSQWLFFTFWAWTFTLIVAIFALSVFLFVLEVVGGLFLLTHFTNKN